MHGLVAVDWHVIWQQVFHPHSVFFRTLWATVYISIVSQAAGVLLGLLAALARVSRFAPLRWLSGVYVWIFRGTPLLVQIFYIYFAVQLADAPLRLLDHPRCRDRRHHRAEHQRGRVHARDHPGRDRLGRQRARWRRRSPLGMTLRAGDAADHPAAGGAGDRAAARQRVQQHDEERPRSCSRSASSSCSPTPSRTTRSSSSRDYFLAIAFWYLMLTTVWTFIQAWIERRLAKSERGEELSFRERLQAAWNPIRTPGSDSDAPDERRRHACRGRAQELRPARGAEGRSRSR